MHREDAEVRARLDRGEEDTLVNLLRFGVTFTKEYRIDDRYLSKYGQSTLVNAFAENRANDLVRALGSGSPNEGVAHMRAFLEKKGYSFATPADRARVKSYLLANLARMRDEIRRYISQTQAGDRFQLFEDRGISLDTNLWPDFLIDQHLASMLRKGLLGPGSVHRVAVVGPGLDFANKEMGNDFYPRQTIQPFAVLDSLVRLGLSNPASVELYTLDISSEVNFHIARARKNAAAGRAYVVQLPWNTAARMTDEYRQSFTEYWEKLGSSIGESVPPIAVPAAAAAETETRAVKIRPAVVLRITPLDTNIVIERPARAAQSGFDLIIGTNIFVYFGEFGAGTGPPEYGADAQPRRLRALERSAAGFGRRRPRRLARNHPDLRPQPRPHRVHVHVPTPQVAHIDLRAASFAAARLARQSRFFGPIWDLTRNSGFILSSFLHFTGRDFLCFQ